MIWLLEQIETIEPQRILSSISGLSAERQKRLSAYRSEAAKMQSILAELLLRHALLRERGLRELPALRFTELGKPYFPTLPDCRFNLSHSRTAVACALDRSPVGVDVQELRRYDQRLARVLSEEERDWVEKEYSDARFTQLWTLKEAYGKKRGQGILYDLRSVTLLPQGEAWRALDCVFQSYARQDCYLTVCAERELPFHVLTPEELFEEESTCLTQSK